MNKVNWTTSKKISIGKYKIPCSEDLQDQNNQVAGIRRDASNFILKTILWPTFKLKNDLLLTGLLKRG